MLAASNWSGGVAPSADDVLVFDEASAVSAVLSANASFAGMDIQNGSLTLDLAHDLTLTDSFDIASAAVVNKTGVGDFNVEGIQTHGSGATLNVNAGEANLLSNAGSAGSMNLEISVVGATAQMNFLSSQHVKSINVDDAGLVRLSSGGNKVIVTQSVSVDAAANSKLDLTNNDMIIEYGADASPYYSVASLISTWASNNNAYDLAGSGITSSIAQIDYNVTAMTVLGFADNSLLTLSSFAGETVSANSVLVKYTYFGDANLDGLVDGDDYALIDTGFNSSGALSGWLFGDFTYDGFIDTIDYGYIDYVAGAQGAPL